MMVTCQWLGTAGLEFSLQGYTLLIDPFFTRPGRLDVVSGRRVAPDRAAVARRITRADAVLVTHPHYDHLMDVPEVLRLTAAKAYGSHNAVLLLGLHGFPAVEIHTGDRLELGPFSVEVFPAYHTPVPLSGHFNGPLPGELRLPLRLTDYRMDACFSFRITAGGKVLQVGSHPVPAQWLFLSPYQPASSLAEVLRAARPLVVAPIHWEDFMRPGDRPLRPMLLTPMQSGRRFPPIQHVDLAGFERLAREAAPGVKVLWMGQFQPFEVE